MKAKRDYELVKNGKYNRRAIMQRAYVYVCNYNYSLSGALKMAWCDAHLKMDEFKAQVTPMYQDYPKPANNFRQTLVDLNPTFRYYDSSWR
jgi:hypothetical protein